MVLLGKPPLIGATVAGPNVILEAYQEDVKRKSENMYAYHPFLQHVTVSQDFRLLTGRSQNLRSRRTRS
jgi:hypothetical protein